MRSTCGLKPMSSIRSASSRTRIFTCSSVIALRSSRSLSRPGVATRTCAVRARFDWACSGTPPYTVATLMPRGAIASISPATCVASSRVGTSTTAAGLASRASILSTTGIAKLSVLPEPVGAFARTSRPASASRRTCSWIGNGVGMSRSASARTMRADTPSWKRTAAFSVLLLWFVTWSRSVCLDPHWRNRRSQTSQDDGCRPCPQGSSHADLSGPRRPCRASTYTGLTPDVYRRRRLRPPYPFMAGGDAMAVAANEMPATEQDGVAHRVARRDREQAHDRRPEADDRHAGARGARLRVHEGRLRARW